MSVLFLMPEKSKEEWKMPKKKEMCSSVSIEPDKGIVMMSISELHDFKGGDTDSAADKEKSQW